MSKVNRSTFIRKREVWFPTIWGWLALLVLVAAASLLVARNLHPFLALNRPVGARLLVIEGWMDPEGLDQAIAVFHSGGYERAVTTGGPINWPGYSGYATYAERAAAYLRQHGVAEALVTAVPAPQSAQNRTYLTAVMVREWEKGSGLASNALDVFSWGTHARRSRLLYRAAFGPDVEVGVYAASPTDYDANAWWRTTSGARNVLEQAIGFIWTKCCFWPPTPGSHEERWN